MRFGILGPLDVSDAGGRVEVPGRRRRLLLVRLLVAANEVVPADVLLDDVWADAPRPRTSSTLTSHVQTLRRLVGRDRVVTGDGGYRVYVDVDVDELDVDAFDADAVAGRRALSRTDGRSAVEALTRALAVWRGPALADAIGIGWADRHAARLEESRRTAIESLLGARLLLGEHHELVADAEVGVRDEPFRERRWAVLMLALYRSGRQADALRAYQRLRGVLGSELGVAPSAALSWLDAAILRHDALLDAVTVDELVDAPNSLVPPPVRVGPAAPSRHSLPLPRDELVGRDRELSDLPPLLNASRLVTLTGVGGIGKTRLAIETASRIGERFDTAAFVDLAAVSDPSHVVAATVTALQVAVPSRADPTEALLATLRDRNTLLLLDNAEHLLAAVGGLVDLILERCHGCHVLVTSRQPLHLRGERIWQVAPLDATTGAELFTARLGGPIDEERIIELCRRLDGIPLAIELAAATCRTVGVANLVERLDARFDLLLGQQSSAGRHASLRATLEWSHALLSVAERQLLRRLAVFTGSFTLRAVEAICGPLDSSRPVAAVLAALVDKSLVVFEPASGRHRLLETVRLFAVQQLDAEETIGVHDAHATWYRDELLAQPWVDVTTLHPFVPEAPNLLAAADWCAVQGRQHDVVVLLSRSAGVWVELMHEAHVAARALAAYEQCHDELSAGEDAIACAFFGVSLAKGRVWRQRGVDRDPQLECRQARSNAVALALAAADHHPRATIASLTALRALPGGLDPDVRLLASVAEAQARCRLDDIDGAAAVYAALVDDRESMFWAGPMLALAAIRALQGDVAGAEVLLDLVDRHPSRHLRLGPHTARAVRIQVEVARGELAAAERGLRRFAEVRGQYDTTHRSIDHLWFESAAYLAAARGEIGRAAHLADAADRTLGDGESSPFVSWTLQRRHGQHPAWYAARSRTVSLDEAARLAAATANG